jgi:hypothetical protein
MRQRIIKLSFVFILGFYMAGCVSAKKELYYEPAIGREAVRFKRVALVPNRLPLNLNDPEKWRKFNWEVAAEFFRKHDVEVVDYETSVEAFKNSGLPIEDTKSSRDKYAELAEQLAADVIIIPYYGNSATTKTVIFFTSMKWESVVTFQFFLRDRNEFISRLDATGADTYVSGLSILPGLLLIAVDPSVGGLISLAGTVLDLSQTLFRTSDSHWRSAFRKAINDGLIAFLETYPIYSEEPRKKKDREIEKLLEPAETTKLPNFRAMFPELDKYSDEQILAAYRQKFSNFSTVSDDELIKLIEAKYGPKK